VGHAGVRLSNTWVTDSDPRQRHPRPAR